MLVFLNWMGAAAMVAAPYFMHIDAGKYLVIVGFILLTIQAVRERIYNLIALNILGIIGYTYALTIGS